MMLILIDINMNTSDVALIARALGDENRLRIVKLLSGGEMCACCLLEKLSITQPTLSHHMKILCESGLVNVRKEGKWSHYSVCTENLSFFTSCIESLSRPEEVCPCQL